ncbi:MAG: uracil-DNA glycosylase family protein [Bacteroidota bacterium]
MNTTADKLLHYFQKLEPPADLPQEVGVMNPYENEDSYIIASAFYRKYYSDHDKRIICFGINPGRFGAGITGVPFTDPIRLERDCGIPNKFEKRAELSSKFIYEMIHAFGGPRLFFSQFYISAGSPLGYVKDGINLNYYDIKGYKKIFADYAVAEIRKQLEIGMSTTVAFSIGKGKNIDFLNWLNDKHGFFTDIIPLPHPRWVMQYRLKRKEEFIEEYLQQLKRFS